MTELTSCYAYINARILPIVRGKRFETPLHTLLIEKAIGRAPGGGTLQDEWLSIYPGGF